MDDDIDSLKEAVQKLDVQQTCSMDTAAENHRGKTHKNSPLHPDWKPIPTPAIIRELEHINDDLAAMGYSLKEWKESNLS